MIALEAPNQENIMVRDIIFVEINILLTMG